MYNHPHRRPSWCQCVIHVRIHKSEAGLLFESKYCPKQNCGSPQAKYFHMGEWKMRCTKTKCRHITRSLVSVYFHQGGAAPSSDRIQTELALCFAWGTASHRHKLSDRRPSCCPYIPLGYKSSDRCIYHPPAHELLHTSHDQDWYAASARAGEGRGRHPDPSWDRRASIRQAASHYPDIRSG